MLSNTSPILIGQNLGAPKMLPRAKSVVGSTKGGVLSGAEKRIGLSMIDQAYRLAVMLATQQ